MKIYVGNSFLGAFCVDFANQPNDSPKMNFIKENNEFKIIKSAQNLAYRH